MKEVTKVIMISFLWILWLINVFQSITTSIKSHYNVNLECSWDTKVMTITVVEGKISTLLTSVFHKLKRPTVPLLETILGYKNLSRGSWIWWRWRSDIVFPVVSTPSLIRSHSFRLSSSLIKESFDCKNNLFDYIS